MHVCVYHNLIDPFLMDWIAIIDFPFASGSNMSWHGTVTDPILILNFDILLIMEFLQ